jgi:hypothetical protein
MNIDHINRILKDTDYKDWVFLTGSMGSGWYIQVHFMAPDNDSPGSDPIGQKGRKFYISPHMTEGEVVQTCFLAIKTAEEHEMREHFQYRKQRVFGPHFNLGWLAEQLASDPSIANDHRPIE